MPSGAMSILQWERGVQYRSWGGGSSEVEGGLGQRADTKNKYEEGTKQAPEGHGHTMYQGDISLLHYLEWLGCVSVEAGVFRTHLSRAPCARPHCCRVGRAGLASPPDSISRLKPSFLCCPSCHLSSSSGVLLSPSHSPVTLLVFRTCGSLSSRQVNTNSKNQSWRKIWPHPASSHIAVPLPSPVPYLPTLMPGGSSA